MKALTRDAESRLDGLVNLEKLNKAMALFCEISEDFFAEGFDRNDALNYILAKSREELLK